MDYTYENLMAIIDEPATEGKNMDAYDAFNKALQSGKNNISQANKNVKDGKYDAAIANLQQAKKDFQNGITEINNVPAGILSDSVIQWFAKSTVSVYKMFREAETLNKYSLGVDNPYKDWSENLTSAAMLRAIYSLATIIPGGQVFGIYGNAIYGSARRYRNTQAAKARGEKKKFTFSGFKEDLIWILNAFIDATDGLIKNVHNQKLYKSRDPIANESCYSDKIDELLGSF